MKKDALGAIEASRGLTAGESDKSVRSIVPPPISFHGGANLLKDRHKLRLSARRGDRANAKMHRRINRPLSHRQPPCPDKASTIQTMDASRRGSRLLPPPGLFAILSRGDRRGDTPRPGDSR